MEIIYVFQGFLPFLEGALVKVPCFLFLGDGCN